MAFSAPPVSAMVQSDNSALLHFRAISYDSVCIPSIPPRSARRPKPPELAKIRNKLQKKRRPSDTLNSSSHVGYSWDETSHRMGPYSNSCRSTLSGLWSFKNAHKEVRANHGPTEGMSHDRIPPGSSDSNNPSSSQELEKIWQQLPDIASRYSASSQGDISPSTTLSSPSTTFDYADWRTNGTEVSSIYASVPSSPVYKADMEDIVVSAEIIAEQYRSLLISRASTRSSMRTPLPPVPTPAPGHRRYMSATEPDSLRPHPPAPKLRRRASLPNLRQLNICDTEVTRLSGHVSQLTSSLSAAMRMEPRPADQCESNAQIGLLIEAYEDLQQELRLSSAIDEADAEEVHALNDVIDEWLAAVNAVPAEQRGL